MKKVILSLSIVLGAALLILSILCFQPVPVVKGKNAITVKGVIVDVYEGGVNDVVFKLDGDNVSYYVNRGTEFGLNVESLKKKLIGNQVMLKYPDYWTPLDWNNKSRHLSKVEFNDEIIFNELR